MLLELQRQFRAAVLTYNDGPFAARGIAVHRATVRAGLTETLATAFPVVRRIVGEEFFSAMARAFIAAAPPSVPQLSRFGEGFADFIAGFAAAGSLPYLADVARLEWARAESYFAADAPRLDPAALQSVTQTDVAALRLRVHPATRLVRSRFPIARIWAVNQQADVPMIDLSIAENVIVTRPADRIVARQIGAGDAAFVAAIMDSLPFSAAAAHGQEADVTFDLQASLQAHLVDGAFAAPLP